MSQIGNLTSESEPPQHAGPPAPQVSWRRTALRLCVSGLALVVLFGILPREQLWTALRRVPPAIWLTSLAVYLSLHLLGVIKWRLTVNLTGAGLGLVQSARCYYGGLFGSTFLPSIVGGDVVRAGMAFRQTRCRTGLVMGCLLDRLIDLTALATVASFGALLLANRFEMLGRNVLLPLGGAIGVTAAVVATMWKMIPARRLSYRVRRRLVKLRQAFRAVMRRPGYVLTSLALGVTLQSSLVLLNAWLGWTCGLESSLAVWLFVWPFAKLAAVLPFTQGGIGVREAALAALFLPFGVPSALVVAVGLVYQSVVVTGGLIGGPLALALGRIRVNDESRVPMTSHGLQADPCKTM
jgi:glycosyltransferase 2 family protein